MTSEEADRAVRIARIAAQDAAVLIVRSVLVPETDNALINPRHGRAEQLRLLSAVAYPLDSRLFGTG